VFSAVVERGKLGEAKCDLIRHADCGRVNDSKCPALNGFQWLRLGLGQVIGSHSTPGIQLPVFLDSFIPIATTIFTERCLARTTLSQDVCPSVCLSHAGIVSKWLNISSNVLHRRSGSHINQTSMTMTIFQWVRRPSNGTGCRMHCRGYENIVIFHVIFDQYLALSLKWYKIWS